MFWRSAQLMKAAITSVLEADTGTTLYTGEQC